MSRGVFSFNMVSFYLRYMPLFGACHVLLSCPTIFLTTEAQETDHIEDGSHRTLQSLGGYILDITASNLNGAYRLSHVAASCMAL